MAHRAARESMVLLKNDGILPLDPARLKTIGVIGPNADSRSALIGNYHGTSSQYITVLDGIRNIAGASCRILYSEGCHLWKENVEHLSSPEQMDRLSEAAAVAEHSDVVILVLGLDETLEGEEGDTGNSDASGDKQDLLFPLSQRKLTETVLQSGKPIVIVNMTGSAMDLRAADAQANAILQAWYPGARGGQDAAELLFGMASPSGKLPVTFYRGTEDLPDFEDYSMKNRTYRYYAGEALYPFGYGLTYGECRVESADCEKTASPDGRLEAVKITARIRNDGKMETEDVLQVYVKDLD